MSGDTSRLTREQHQRLLGPVPDWMECLCGQTVLRYPGGVKRNADRQETPHRCEFYKSDPVPEKRS